MAAQMIEFADGAVALASHYEIPLDFSAESVQTLEMILDQLHGTVAELSEEDLRVHAMVWGAYLGEVIRRRWGGEWTMESAVHTEAVPTLRMDDGEIYPPSRVFARITQGAENNVWHFFLVLARGHGEVADSEAGSPSQP
jgi:hypothetical protein